jgi:hypothetical protein
MQMEIEQTIGRNRNLETHYRRTSLRATLHWQSETSTVYRRRFENAFSQVFSTLLLSHQIHM